MAKKTYILDTNVYLSDPTAFKSFGRNDVVIPLKVLEEIDKHKKRQDGVGANARHTIRLLDEYRGKGSLETGVRIERGKGLLRARISDINILPVESNKTDPDNIILACALNEVNDGKKVVVVSRDINLRVRCDALGMDCEGYDINQVVNDRSELYRGFVRHLVDDQTIDHFYQGEKIFVEKEEKLLFPNQFVMLISNSNEKKTALARFLACNKPLIRAGIHKHGVWDITPRNKEQSFAIDLLLDPSIPIVSLIGAAGCGKTLLAVAAGLEQVLEEGNQEPIYNKLVVSRPVMPMGRDIGFLPGTLEEKMAPWLAPVQDNLQFLMGNDKVMLEMYAKKGIIEIEALTYIRGRSIANAFIIIDEAQNLSVHELKTIITRVGEGTKIVLTGDIEQIDTVYLDATSNGLSYAVEKFKEHDLAGHVTLQKGERSKVATLAAKVL
jgi:PhoH-like ATPase|tara:strand:- start:2419 stop:3735 length:1317 start_codon:yes stop_codon:yes gene_type:complete